MIEKRLDPKRLGLVLERLDMIAQRVIAGSIAAEGAVRIAITCFTPLEDDWVRLMLGVLHLLAGAAGFMVIRWDIKQRDKELSARD